MAEEADQMRSQGIELQHKISAGQKKVKNIQTYTQEIEIVIEDSQTEVVKYKAVITEQKIEKAKEV